MIVAALAPLLFVSLAQSPPRDSEPVDPQAYQEEPVNGYEAEPGEASEPDDGAGDADERAEDRADAADDDSADEADEEEERVCRRVHYIDDFGRQRSRKSCRPR